MLESIGLHMKRCIYREHRTRNDGVASDRTPCVLPFRPQASAMRRITYGLHRRLREVAGRATKAQDHARLAVIAGDISGTAVGLHHNNGHHEKSHTFHTLVASACIIVFSSIVRAT
jgi:hypothetical protein